MAQQCKNEKEKIAYIKQQLTKITREFCTKWIDEEYADLCENLIAKMARKRAVPFISGRLDIWAASVVWAIGRVNFLGDKTFAPYLSLDDVANHFGVSKSTVGQKATKICELMKLQYYDSEFSTHHMARQNPFSRMVVDANGFIHIRDDPN